MVPPAFVQRLQEVVVERGEHVLADLGLQVCGHGLAHAVVQALAVLQQYHCVRVAVQLLKAQARVVLLVYLLYGVLQHGPRVVHELLVGARRERLHPHVTPLLGYGTVHDAGASSSQGVTAHCTRTAAIGARRWTAEAVGCERSIARDMPAVVRTTLFGRPLMADGLRTTEKCPRFKTKPDGSTSGGRQR